jgi:hypothetical protein
MLDAQTGLRLLWSSCSNTAAIEKFSIRICNRENNTFIVSCYVSTEGLQCLRICMGNIIEGSQRKSDIDPHSVSHAGNFHLDKSLRR